jgi:hypothetical protein
MRLSHRLWLGATACIALWLVLVVGVAPRTGWIHVPLAVGFLLAVRAIVAGDEERRGRGGT